MNTHDILLTVQYVTVAVLFAELFIVFLRWKNSIHSYLFLTCISSFISNLGYLLEMKAGSVEAYITALKLSYAGRVWIAFAFFLFSAKMCRRKLPKGLVAFLALLHTGIYLAILTLEKHGLYYRDYSFIPDPEFPKFIHTNGNVHDLLMGLNAIFIILATAWVVAAFRKERNRTSKMRLFMLLLSIVVQASSFLLQITGIFSVSEYYDITMLGALFGTVFMLVGIFAFDLLGAREIARDFVVDRISEGIIAVDNDGRIQYYNEPAAKLYPEFDVFFKSGSLTADTTHILTPYDIMSVITGAVRAGETLKVGDRIFTPEENDLIYKGECYGKLYALVDDTEHYQYMEELQKQRDIADSANEAKSRFLASMSHEIRTPINAVLGMDEMILRESNEKPIRAYAADIMSAGRTLLSLINDILDLSKVEEGKMEIIPVRYDLSSLINDLVNMIRERAQKKGLKLNIDVDEHIPHILLGDEIRIRQCVMNCLTNAVKYTEKGSVTMRVGFSALDVQNRIVLNFSIEDTGIGMKKEEMEKLFSPYERLDEKRNRSIEGTGLGMSITRQLLVLMGSKLMVKSEYGVGSAFSFGIEQEVISDEEIGDYSKRFDENRFVDNVYHELFHAPEARILVVDDTEMNLTVIRNLLKKTQIRIDTAESGREALNLTDTNGYDAIFIDHMMPDMNGIETLSAIRSSGKNTGTPAVALTANAVSGARQMYLDAGFTDYLSKPVDGEKLEKMLCEMLPDDKIVAADSTDTDPDSKDDAEVTSPEVYGHLEEMNDVDWKSGIRNCGSVEGYLSVLSVFHRTAGIKADEIETLLKDGDITNYTIKVHALKSSARIIGAADVSGLAKDLEDAGKREDIVFIRENTDRLLEMYRDLDGRLSWLDGSDKKLEDIDERMLKEAYRTIFEIAGSMDYEMMEDILKNLHGYNLSEADTERLGRIERMLTELDWDGIIKITSEAL